MTTIECQTGNNNPRPRMVGRLRTLSRECDTGTPVLVRYPNGRGPERWVPGWPDADADAHGRAPFRAADGCDDVPLRYMRAV